MSNIEKIRQAMHGYECNAMLIINPINRLFATGFPSSAGVLFVTGSDAWFFTDSRYIEAAEAAVSDACVSLITKDEPVADSIKAIIKEKGITSTGFEDSSLSYASHKDWAEKLAVEMIPADKLISDLRNIKSRADLDKMIKAQRLSEKVFNEVLPLISTNVTEKDIAAEIIYRSLRNGAEEVSFNPVVLSGKNSSRPHGVPGNEKIGKGFLTIDYGVSLDGWCSDTTRTLCIGQPDEEMAKIYNTVLDAQIAGINTIRSGVNGVDVDSAARKVIEDAGYGKFFGHGFGHSIGLEVHESLKAAPTSKDVLPVGTVITAEPGIYLPGRYGVRIEDTLYITENGSENITTLPKELTIL